MSSLLAFAAGIAPAALDFAPCVAGIEQLLYDPSVGHGGMRDGEFAYELVALVQAVVQFVAEVILAMLPCLLQIHVFLGAFMLFRTQ